MNHPQHLDVVVAGLAVADIIGRPVNLRNPPRRGTLKLIDSITLTTGGNVSNVGIDLAKLGFKVGVVTRVGSDLLGRLVTQHYRAFGIDTEGVIVDVTAQTSATMVSVDKDGERTFLHTRGCMKHFRAEDILHHLPLLRKAKMLAIGYLGLIPETEREFKKLFQTLKSKTTLKILLDTAAAPRVSSKALKGFLPYVDYFIPSYEEAMLITGRRTPEAIVQYLLAAGAPHTVGVKLGSKGCFLATHQRSEYVRARQVRHMVDATGAGDAFVAGFLAATIRGFNPFKAARVANAVAASCVTAVGASTAIKAFEEYV
ncbi:MAG: PfkB family carbohydrate kinase [Bacteroidota bacterium]